MSDSEEKGFKVSDKRRFTDEGESKDDAPEEKENLKQEPAVDSDHAKAAADGPGADAPLPEINFTTFIYSLSTSALVHLGDIPDPLSQESRIELPLAKQTIDIIGMLKDKSKGNLENEEAMFIENVLTDLRMRFVQVSQAAKAKGAETEEK